MKVKLGQAVKLFFGNSSLEMVYFEAIANALDADATEINIEIRAAAFNQPETIEITISDNGVGFSDDRYRKFSKLFDVDESTHKGIGRLVYLCYFDEIQVESYFTGINKREFSFTEGFREEDAKVTTVNDRPSGTILRMRGYTLSRLRTASFIQPENIKNRIYEEFLARLFNLKSQDQQVRINIQANIENKITRSKIDNNDIPDFETLEFESEITLFDKFYLYFSIIEVEPLQSKFIAAVSVDNRTMKVDLISEENKPLGYRMIFLLYSDWFRGKVDAARQNLTVSEGELQNIKTIFRKRVAELIEERVPQITDRNNQMKKALVDTYPHLSGYFDVESVGYVSKADILKKAQEQFFRAQKELLEANSYSEEQFEKSLEISARALTEYVLFRQITINALKNTTPDNSEAELHRLFATMKTRFDNKNLSEDLYRNNAWLLDDKYMTYETVLSDRQMGELIEIITDNEYNEADIDRPDLALVFSSNPESSHSFDVVIVELKKKGLPLEENMKTVTQLEKRARKLMAYYENRIQRLWYYGIVEFNEELELHLGGEFQELYSSGKIYYKDTTIMISKDPVKRLPIGIYIWDINAVVTDAEARNSAFLALIKRQFK